MTSYSPKLLPPSTGPRLIVYHQTIHDPQGNCNSLLPLLTNNTGVTHVIVAAIHLNDGPGNITLNDHRPDDKRYDQLWGEVSWLQGSGVKVLGMLGGAAKGTFERLGGDDESVRISMMHGHMELILGSLKRTTSPCTPLSQSTSSTVSTSISKSRFPLQQQPGSLPVYALISVPNSSSLSHLSLQRSSLIQTSRLICAPHDPC